MQLGVIDSIACKFDQIMAEIVIDCFGTYVEYYRILLKKNSKLYKIYLLQAEMSVTILGTVLFRRKSDF